jgi:hypothetical protein
LPSLKSKSGKWDNYPDAGGFANKYSQGVLENVGADFILEFAETASMIESEEG